MKEITVLTFGIVTEIIGRSSFVMSNVTSTEELKQQLETTFPPLKNINFAIAVNKQMITTPMQLESNATIALLPPFSGG
jgi:molybdopterin synthase sulfur carrier subunit